MPCVYSFPLLLTVWRASRVPLCTGERLCALLPCNVLFVLCPPLSKVYREQQSRSSGWRPGKTPFGLSFFVKGVGDEDRKRVHRIGAAVPAVLLAFFRLFVEASYLAAPPARAKTHLWMSLSLSCFFFFFSAAPVGHSIDRVKKKKKVCG